MMLSKEKNIKAIHEKCGHRTHGKEMHVRRTPNLSNENDISITTLEWRNWAIMRTEQPTNCVQRQ